MRTPNESKHPPAGALLLAALAFAALPAGAQEKKAPTPPPAKADAAAEADADRVVEPEAAALLKAAWDWLGTQESYAFHADIEYDEIYEDAIHLRVAGRVDALVRRPDRFKVFFEGDRGQKTFFYDGRSFVLTDLRSKTWATTSVTGSNDAAVDTIVGKLGVRLPLSDFLVTGAAYGANELRAAYVVGQSRVAGKRCHQVLVLLDDLDFQLWIEADGNPVIRKMVLTYRESPGQPQFEATFTEWYPLVKLSDYAFTFLPDDSFRRVELATPVVEPAAPVKE